MKKGFIDDAEEIAPHLWGLAPVDALRQMYSAREGIGHGFLHCRRLWDETEDPGADLTALAGGPSVRLSGYLSKKDGDVIEVRASIGDQKRKVVRYDIDDGLAPIIAKMNGLLAESGSERRIYECANESQSYALVATTPEGARELEAERFGPLRLEES